MCVIMCYESDFPKLATLKSAESFNNDGGGMGWIEGDFVHWEKGITADEMIKIIEEKKLQLPIVIHFRIATIGGRGKELTHPFPITNHVPLNVKGRANEVLFHNGHWGEWREMCLKTMIRHKIEFPRDLWSDSRGMAWLASIYGKGMLNLVTGSKIAVLTKKGVERYSDGWKTVDGATCSNDNFDNKTITYTEYGMNNFDEVVDDTYGYWKKGIYTTYQKHNANKKKEVEELNTKLVADNISDETKKKMNVQEKLALQKRDEKVDTVMENAVIKEQIGAITKGVHDSITEKKREKVDDELQLDMREEQKMQKYKDDYDEIGDEILAQNWSTNKGFIEKYVRKREDDDDE